MGLIVIVVLLVVTVFVVLVADLQGGFPIALFLETMLWESVGAVSRFFSWLLVLLVPAVFIAIFRLQNEIARFSALVREAHPNTAEADSILYSFDQYLINAHKGWDYLQETVLWFVIISLVLGFYPIILSLITVAIPLFSVGADAQRVMGARNPSKATGEQQAIQTALRQLESRAKRLKVEFVLPEQEKGYLGFMVLDNPFPNSFTIGRIVYLTRGLFETEYLGAAMAHEFGHLTYRDGRLLLALRRLVIPLAYWFGIDRSPKAAGIVTGSGAVTPITMGDDAALYYKMKTVDLKLKLAFWMGGLGLLFKAAAWADEWKNRDLRADAFAVKLGYKLALQQLLTDYKELDIAQPYLLSGRPYTAERLDNLLPLLEPQITVTPVAQQESLVHRATTKVAIIAAQEPKKEEPQTSKSTQTAAYGKQLHERVTGLSGQFREIVAQPVDYVRAANYVSEYEQLIKEIEDTQDLSNPKIKTYLENFKLLLVIVKGLIASSKPENERTPEEQEQIRLSKQLSVNEKAEEIVPLHAAPDTIEEI